ncbi:hypothetical protein [Flavobacterium sp.]|uniref:hypothetical protein n=1 Tax=Flavobacterium sp. TaxID=239 RepID=UPI002626991A|nr:hypothetical protein [Flavobacterium sp.]
MNFLPETIIAFVVLAGIIIYTITAKAYRKRKVKLLAKYRQARTKSIQYQDTLSAYILKHNAQHEAFVQGATYGEYLKQLQKHHIKNLSEKGYQRLRRSPVLIKQNLKKLEREEAWLKEAGKHLSMLREKETA